MSRIWVCFIAAFLISCGSSAPIALPNTTSAPTATPAVAPTSSYSEKGTIPTPSSGTSAFEPTDPISGYGDFSSIPYRDIDQTEVAALLHQCVRDQGFPVTLLGDGGIGFDQVPREQNVAASDALDRCLAGLALPAPSLPTGEDIQRIYSALLDTATCLEKEGYEVEAAPTFEVFNDSYVTGPWHPYLSLPEDIGPSEWQRINSACPQP